MKLPAEVTAANPAGIDPAEAVARSVTPASAVAWPPDDYELWRQRQQDAYAFRSGDVWED